MPKGRQNGRLGSQSLVEPKHCLKLVHACSCPLLEALNVHCEGLHADVNFLLLSTLQALPISFEV